MCTCAEPALRGSAASSTRASVSPDASGRLIPPPRRAMPRARSAIRPGAAWTMARGIALVSARRPPPQNQMPVTGALPAACRASLTGCSCKQHSDFILPALPETCVRALRQERKDPAQPRGVERCRRHRRHASAAGEPGVGMHGSELQAVCVEVPVEQCDERRRLRRGKIVDALHEHEIVAIGGEQHGIGCDHVVVACIEVPRRVLRAARSASAPALRARRAARPRCRCRTRAPAQGARAWRATAPRRARAAAAPASLARRESDA